MTKTPVTLFDLQPFLVAAQAKVTADYLAWGNDSEYARKNIPQLTLEPGSRYVRIVSESHGHRSSFGFVDLTTGDVLKSNSWKAPAKNFARGNINDENSGCGRIRWTGVF